ncbi:MAG: hypothetical protein VB934_01340 [Polyangiaceae bacterium]
MNVTRRWRLLGSACAMMLGFACHDGGIGGTTVGATASSSSTGGGAGGEGGASGGMGGQGGASTDASSSMSSSMDTCVDQGPGEMNDSPAMATQLAGLNDCDDQKKNVAGTIDGPNDVDWYFFKQTEDTSFCSVGPHRDFSQTDGGSLRLCKYVDCQTGDPPTITCPTGTTQDAGPAGLPGCCGTKPFDVDLGFWGCEGISDLLNIYMRVDDMGSSPSICNNYNINYNL